MTRRPYQRVVTCPYCFLPAALVDSAEVYGGRSYGMIWLCRYDQAWVGVHKNSPTNAPLGRLANAELRRAKQEAHAAFDPLWKSRRMSRASAYAMLAAALGIDVKDCHIGLFDVETCKRAVEICEARVTA